VTSLGRTSAVIALAGVLALLITGIASAASPHFIGKVKTADLGTQLQASGKIAGLGNGDVTLVLTATGVADVRCANPGGNTDVPGQRQTITTTGTVSGLRPENGNVVFSVVTAAPIVGPEACPNPQWTPRVVDVAFSSARLDVYQGGALVLSTALTP
jgi:hypothetical protein